MDDGLSGLFPVILVAALASLALSPLLLRAVTVVGLVDVPGSAPHKRHLTEMPLAGGPVLWLAAFVSYILLRPGGDTMVRGILVGGTIMLAWGMIDDRYGMRAYVKMLGQMVAAIVLVLFGIQVRVTQTNWLDLALTLIWVIGMINAFNFVDSMDGLALGLASIALAFFMLATLDAGQPTLAVLAAAGLGSALGLFFFNASPAKLFLGDSGAQLLGFLLAALGIAYVPAGAGLPQGVSWFAPILVLGVPIFDATLVVVSRLRRGRPIYEAQHDHTYHRLVGLGLHPSRSVLAMQVTAVLLGLTAFVALGMSVLMANVLFAGLVLSGMLSMLMLERTFPKERPG